MIVLFTDFGAAGPYVGPMRAAPGAAVVELMSHAPAFAPRASTPYRCAEPLGREETENAITPALLRSRATVVKIPT